MDSCVPNYFLVPILIWLDGSTGQILRLIYNLDEMINFFSDPKSKPTVSGMTSQLQNYCKLQKDPFADLPQIKLAMDKVLGK